MFTLTNDLLTFDLGCRFFFTVYVGMYWTYAVYGIYFSSVYYYIFFNIYSCELHEHGIKREEHQHRDSEQGASNHKGFRRQGLVGHQLRGRKRRQSLGVQLC